MADKFERMKLAVAKGIEMRTAQKQYFRTRDRSDLGISKRLEKEFDSMATDAQRDDDLLEATEEEKPKFVKVAGLFPGANDGDTAEVDDAMASVAGAIVIGHGTQKAKVRFDGKEWRIVKFLEARRG